MKKYSGKINKLQPNQVFVFGSNLDGFHGGGAAGFASFGVHGNVWRAIGYDSWTDGKKGLLNVKGVAEGFQVGEVGMSYAIPTVTRAGAKRSIPLETIKESVAKLYAYAKECDDLEFLVAYSANGRNLNGYSAEEMAGVFAQDSIPENVVFEEGFAELIEYKLRMKGELVEEAG